MAKSNYYPEDEEMGNTEQTPPTVDKPEPDTAEGETFLVNTSALGSDLEVGDECTIRILALHDDEAECEYVKPEKEESSKPSEKSFPETIGDRLRAGGRPMMG